MSIDLRYEPSILFASRLFCEGVHVYHVGELFAYIPVGMV